MASYTLTVEDCSPLVTYDPAGAWSDSSPDDSLLSSYSGRSYHSTSTRGATATIDFHGTGLAIMGGKRTNYGRFVASADGNMVFDGTAWAPQNTTQQILGTISRLPSRRHRVVVENVDGLPMDIDSFIVTDEVGSPGAKMEAKTYDDVDPSMIYSPSPEAWGINRLPVFQAGTIHFSQDPNAAASMRFLGDAVAVYGTVSPDHANMKVTLDGEFTILRGGSNGGVNQLRPQVLLYYKSRLGPGSHVLSIASETPSTQAPFIDLDSVVVFSEASNSPLGNASVSSSTQTGIGAETSVAPAKSPNRPAGDTAAGRISTGVLAGAIVAGGVGLLACLGLCLFAWCWRKRRDKPTMLDHNRSDSPELPMQQEPRRLEGGMISRPLESSVFIFPPKAVRAVESSRHSIAPSYYSSPESGRSHSPLLRPPGMRTVPAKAAPAMPRAPVLLDRVERPPRRPLKRPTMIDFNELAL